MKEIFAFLVENPEIVELVKKGTASLVGVSSEDAKAIIELFTGDNNIKLYGYWK